jgi:hypothetical protein
VADKLAYDETAQQIAKIYGKDIGGALYRGATGATWGARRTKINAALVALAQIIHAMGEMGHDVIAHTMSELPTETKPTTKDWEKVYEKVIGTGTVNKGT